MSPDLKSWKRHFDISIFCHCFEISATVSKYKNWTLGWFRRSANSWFDSSLDLEISSWNLSSMIYEGFLFEPVLFQSGSSRLCPCSGVPVKNAIQVGTVWHCMTLNQVSSSGHETCIHSSHKTLPEWNNFRLRRNDIRWVSNSFNGINSWHWLEITFCTSE